jgi:hypothetical protein
MKILVYVFIFQSNALSSNITFEVKEYGEYRGIIYIYL